MKKERNCGGNIGMPMYQNNMPMMMPPQPLPTPNMMYSAGYSTSYNNIEEQINNMQQQINMLENRINKLEGKSSNNYSTKYSESNYYML